MTSARGAVTPYKGSRASCGAAKRPVHCVTLINHRRAPLFQLTLQAGSELDAAAQAQDAYNDVLVGLGDLRNMTRETAKLTVDPSKTRIAAAGSPGSIKLTYLVRSAGETRHDEHVRRLTKDDAVVLLRSVAEADASLLTILADNGTVDMCPAHTWSPRSGWLTIDSCFRASDAAGRVTFLHPASPTLRLAAELVVLRLLLGLQETVRLPLAHRWRLESHAISSATLRAFHRTAGPRSPDTLIAWLRDHGHAALAATLAAEFRR